MAVFELVSPALVWAFAVVSIIAALVHRISGSHQKNYADICCLGGRKPLVRQRP